MSRDWRLYLDDLREACRKVLRYTEGLSKDELLADERTYDAVVRNLEIIGEATNNLPEEVRGKAGDIDWRKIIGLRNILAHAYFGIDDDILWDVIQNHVSNLLQAADHFANSQHGAS